MPIRNEFAEIVEAAETLALAADREFASLAEATAGTSTTKLLNPALLTQVRRYGEQPIQSGDDFCVVGFSPVFSSKPTITGLTVESESGVPGVIGIFDLTASGFTATLNAVADPGCILHWSAAP